MASATDTAQTIVKAVDRITDQVPPLKQLKLVVGLDLMGRGDVQRYRVELPGPKVTKDLATDAKVRVEAVRATFNELAEKGTIPAWKRALKDGDVRVTGPSQVLQLIERVVERTSARSGGGGHGRGE